MNSTAKLVEAIRCGNARAVARAISMLEDDDAQADELFCAIAKGGLGSAVVLGITGPPGAGKSTLCTNLITEFRKLGKRVGVVAVDPSSPLSGGALLGDRIRMMQHAVDKEVFVRSMATRGKQGGLCAAAGSAAQIMAAAGCQVIVLETVGVGQVEMDVVRHADISLLVLAPGLGDEIQAMKSGVVELVDLVAVNKCDLPGADILALEMRAAFPGRPLYETSSVTGDGFSALAGYVAAWRPDTEQLKCGRRQGLASSQMTDLALSVVSKMVSEESTKVETGMDSWRVDSKQLLGLVHVRLRDYLSKVG